MIFIICGTQKFQFDRLIRGLDEQVGQGLIRDELFAQIGGCTYEPVNYPFVRFMDDTAFKKSIEEADLIITHSGTGSIINSIKRGKKVIVVPRLEEYEEHVSDHQVQIAEQFADSDLVRMCLDVDTLPQMIAEMEEFTPREYISNTEHVLQVLEEDILRLWEQKD
ncbi:MAG: beta(1,3)galactosyltransferase EpsH [Lachnospiraceae bacterium]|nr:beta(1,3)galactosyltransferase EpsH [Lachnospiraceae bacterium]